MRARDSQGLVLFIIGRRLPGRLKVNVERMNATQVPGEWNAERCLCPACRHLHAAHNRIERHLQQHADMWANIEALGWLGGIIRTIIRETPSATIADVLGEGEVHQCTVPQCGKIPENERGIKAHFTGYHGAWLQKDCTAPMCKLIQRFELVGEGEIHADVDVLERREGGVEVRIGTGDGGMKEWRHTPREKYPKKRDTGRGCK
jgi:hypothetical protein